jgi:transposase-like protein
MKRHTEQFKLTVVEHYLGGTDGYKEVGRHYGIAARPGAVASVTP